MVIQTSGTRQHKPHVPMWKNGELLDGCLSIRNMMTQNANIQPVVCMSHILTKSYTQKKSYIPLEFMSLVTISILRSTFIHFYVIKSTPQASGRRMIIKEVIMMKCGLCITCLLSSCNTLSGKAVIIRAGKANFIIIFSSEL